MARTLLIVLGLVHFISGCTALLAPQFFYDTIPGLSLMGPFHLHLVRDVGLALIASGGAVMWGALKADRSAAICGSLFPVLHALLHVQIWVRRDFVLDYITAFDFFIVAIPACLMLGLSRGIAKDRPSSMV